MRKHRFDPISFVFGAVFVAVAAFAVFRESIDGDVALWLWPVALVVLGAGLLTSAFRRRTEP